MNKDEFLAAMAVIQAHDDRQARVDKFLREDDAEHGDGMFTYLPDISGKVRRLAINLLSRAAGTDVQDSVVSYYFDEVRTMQDGGSTSYPDGTHFEIRTPADVWTAIEHERALAPPLSPIRLLEYERDD